jgi:hypothetical protein
MEFAAWVPNVSGHLSFSAVGEQLTGDAACYNNLRRSLPNSSLCVIAAQRRGNTDASAVLRWLSRFVRPIRNALNRSGRFEKIAAWINRWFTEGQWQHFFLIARPETALTPYFDHDDKLTHRLDERGALTGSVFIVAEEAEQPYRSSQKNQIENVRYSIETMNGCLVSAEIESGLRDLSEDITTMSDVRIDFTLFRTGECRLRMGDEEHEAQAQRPLLIRHAYYFIRDCAHRHYHHADKDDRLLPAVEVKTEGESNDLAWRREVLWALSRTIGEYRRSRSMAQRRQALGITAYSDAFQATLGRIRRVSDPQPHCEDHSIATFDFTHLKESAKVANEVSAWRRQGSFSVSALAIATSLSVTALWVAISRLGEQRKWIHEGPFAAIIGWYYANPGYVLAAALGVIFLIWDATYSERPVSDRLFKTLLAAGWPGRSYGKRAKLRLYGVALATAAILYTLVDFQFGICLFA